MSHNSAFELLTPPEAAEVLRTKARTIERWRTNGDGPAFVRIGRRVAYRRQDLEAFITQNRTTPSREAGR